MLTRWELIKLALGETEANKVDTAIPQQFFDSQTLRQREDNAGWYYDEAGGAKLFGRLLTQQECWERITQKIKAGKIAAYFCRPATNGDLNIAHYLIEWPCFRYHVEKGEIELEAAE